MSRGAYLRSIHRDERGAAAATELAVPGVLLAANGANLFGDRHLSRARSSLNGGGQQLFAVLGAGQNAWIVALAADGAHATARTRWRLVAARRNQTITVIGAKRGLGGV